MTMNKRKTLDKAEARKRRDQLIESAASAELSLTEGVREMRAISGMTQEDFARHRGVSARVVKGLELGQGNPTVATLNRIGEFFGLEVAFVPIRRPGASTDQRAAGTDAMKPRHPLPEKQEHWHTIFRYSSVLQDNRLQKIKANRIEEQLRVVESDLRHQSDSIDLVVTRLDQVHHLELKTADLLGDRLKSVEVLNQQLEKFAALTQHLTGKADLGEQIKKAELLNERLRELETLSTQLEKAGLLQNQRKKEKR